MLNDVAGINLGLKSNFFANVSIICRSTPPIGSSSSFLMSNGNCPIVEIGSSFPFGCCRDAGHMLDLVTKCFLPNSGHNEVIITLLPG